MLSGVFRFQGFLKHIQQYDPLPTKHMCALNGGVLCGIHEHNADKDKKK